jgi:hypothetical protein
VGVWGCGCGDVGELSVFSFLFIPSYLRRGGTPSPYLASR